MWEWAKIGKYIIVEGHVNPHNSIFAVINTEIKQIEHSFAGSVPTYHSNDVNTIVYAFWNNVYSYDGTLLASLELAENEYIDELAYTVVNPKIEVTIKSEDGIRFVSID